MHHPSPKRSGALARLAKGSGRGIPIFALGALTASALAAYTVHSASGPSAPFVLSGAPSQRAVSQGSAARYQISVSRRSVRQLIRLSVSGTPRYAQTELTSGSRSVQRLLVTTTGRTPAGRYQLVVQGRIGSVSTSIRVGLTVVAPKPVSIGISGTVTALQPGVPKPLDLTLSNPRPWNLSVTGLTVTAGSVSAPRSTPLLPCTLADFSMQQFSGTYPLTLPASRSRTLSSLGVSPTRRPQVTLLNRALDQDGCQGASVTLAYSGKGVTK
jgi:hypothetical protein